MTEAINSRNGRTNAWTENDILSRCSEQTIGYYNILKNYTLNLDDRVSIKFTKFYARFDYKGKIIAYIQPQVNSILLFLHISSQLIHDTHHIVQDMTHTGHHGAAESRLKIENSEQIEIAKENIKKTFSILTGQNR